MLADASVADLVAQASRDEVQLRTPAAAAAVAALHDAGAVATIADRGTVTVTGLTAERVVAVLAAADVAVSAVSAQQATLEDVYLIPDRCGRGVSVRHRGAGPAMTATTAPHPTPAPVQAAESGLWRATVAAEWVKFRTVRGWLIGLVVAAGLMVTFTFVVANGHHQGTCTDVGAGVCQTGHPYVPTGPGGRAVAASYQYYAQTLTGDGTITARIEALSGLISTAPADRAPTLADTEPGLVAWAKAGLLITPSTTQGSAYAAVMATGGHGDRFQDDYTHDQAGPSATVTADTPRWLQLRRSGDTITGYDSTDGTSWHRIGGARLPNLPATVTVGVFVTSPMTARQIPTEASARFDDLALTGATHGTWQAHSIGMDPLQSYPILGTGSAQASGTTVTVTGSGDLALAVPTQAGGDSAAQTLLFGLVVALIVLIIVATGFVTSEYRRGLIRVTLAATPQRATVLLAKALVAGAVAFVVGALTAGIALPIGAHVMTGGGNFLFPSSTATVIRVVVGTGILLALAAAGAVALAAIVRRAAAALSIAILVFVLPMLLGPGVLGPSLSVRRGNLALPRLARRRPVGLRHPAPHRADRLPVHTGQRLLPTTAVGGTGGRGRVGGGGAGLGDIPVAEAGRMIGAILDAVRTEWLKVRTLRSTAALCVGAATVTIAISTLVDATTHVSSAGSGGQDPTKLALGGVYLGQAVIAVLAVLVMGEEYGTGMIRTTFTAIPRRPVVLAGKAVAVAGLAALAGVVAVAGCLVFGRLLLPGAGLGPSNGYPLLGGDTATLRAAAGTVVYLALVALLALGVTAAVRDTAVSLGTVLGLLYLPLLLSAVLGGTWRRHIEQIAPMSAGLAIQATTQLHRQVIGPWAGLGVLACWAIGALVVGGLVLRLRDA